VIKKSPEGQVFHQRQVMGVGLVVPDVETVVVH
jgi:hypothetical protein